MIKWRHPHGRTFDPVLDHENRPVVEGFEKITLFSYPSPAQAPSHKMITVNLLFFDYTYSRFQMCFEVA